MRKGIIRTMRICAMLLQEGAAADASLGQIADLMCDPCEKSARCQRLLDIDDLSVSHGSCQPAPAIVDSGCEPSWDGCEPEDGTLPISPSSVIYSPGEAGDLEYGKAAVVAMQEAGAPPRTVAGCLCTKKE